MSTIGYARVSTTDQNSEVPHPMSMPSNNTMLIGIKALINRISSSTPNIMRNTKLTKLIIRLIRNMFPS